jgi:hypothetical protein
MAMSKASCVNCRRAIDAAARICPFCGANPTTGERIDTQPLMQEVFQPRTLTTSESVYEYARHRQGIVIALSVFVAFLAMAAFHQYAMMRNRTAVTAAPAVALTEIADLSNQPAEVQKIPMPQLGLQFDGHPQTMRTFIVEPDAVTPPEVVAAQQAAAQQAAAEQAAKAQAQATKQAAPAPAARRATPPTAVPQRH